MIYPSVRSNGEMTQTNTFLIIHHFCTSNLMFSWLLSTFRILNCRIREYSLSRRFYFHQKVLELVLKWTHEPWTIWQKGSSVQCSLKKYNSEWAAHKTTPGTSDKRKGLLNVNLEPFEPLEIWFKVQDRISTQNIRTRARHITIHCCDSQKGILNFGPWTAWNLVQQVQNFNEHKKKRTCLHGDKDHKWLFYKMHFEPWTYWTFVLKELNGSSTKENEWLDESKGTKGNPRARILWKGKITGGLTIPQQNGVAERKNQTIMDMKRSMLKSKHLPNEYWAEAVATIVYILNRCPITSVKNVIPQEA